MTDKYEIVLNKLDELGRHLSEKGTVLIGDDFNDYYSEQVNKFTDENGATIREALKLASVAEEMADALKDASAYISQNNPHWSAPYHNETTRRIIEALAKFKGIKG